jgi:hypothetical protein
MVRRSKAKYEIDAAVSKWQTLCWRGMRTIQRALEDPLPDDMPGDGFVDRIGQVDRSTIEHALHEAAGPSLTTTYLDNVFRTFEEHAELPNLGEEDSAILRFIHKILKAVHAWSFERIGAPEPALRRNLFRDDSSQCVVHEGDPVWM